MPLGRDELPSAASPPRDPEVYAAAVIELVCQIPPGRVMTYGLISEVLHDHLGYGGPRLVGNVMSGSGDRLGHLVPEGVDYPWWRVVNAAGAPPAPHAAEALAGLRAEATPLRRDGTRVRLKDAIWFPGADG